MTSKTVKQESSIPVQSRTSIISLAELAKYWEGTEYEIRSMSQLISWSVDLLRDILKANDMINEESNSIIEARNFLISKGLWQHKVANRAFAKIGTAVRFDGFRDKGEDPKEAYAGGKRDYNVLHNKHSVDPYRDRVSSKQKQVTELTKVYHELEAIEEEPIKRGREEVVAEYRRKQAELKKLKEETIDEVKHSDVIPKPGPIVKEGASDEEMAKDRAERDLARTKLENAPFEASDLPIVSDKGDD